MAKKGVTDRQFHWCERLLAQPTSKYTVAMYGELGSLVLAEDSSPMPALVERRHP